MTRLEISNRDARRLWLWTNGLARPETGTPDVMALIRRLGFVPIDTVRNVTRAHHHILWTRNPNYRETMFWPLLRQRALFEHFTHDASLIPVEVLPMWRRRFRRLADAPGAGARAHRLRRRLLARRLGARGYRGTAARRRKPLHAHAYSHIKGVSN